MLNNFFPSPIHYMGNKFDLLNQIFIQFPDIKDVDVFYDIFGGSGCVLLYTYEYENKKVEKETGQLHLNLFEENK